MIRDILGIKQVLILERGEAYKKEIFIRSYNDNEIQHINICVTEVKQWVLWPKTYPSERFKTRKLKINIFIFYLQLLEREN